MARPQKQGIDYFPMDIDLDQDDKLGMIIAEFGFKGENLFTKMCGWIYKTNGYYTEWVEDTQLRFLRRYEYCGFSVSFIQEVVPRFIKWGLFDKTVFDAFQILTSARIQSTWLDASRKRKERVIDQKIWLLEVNSGVTAGETIVSGGRNGQSKVNKIKGNQTKEGSDDQPLDPLRPEITHNNPTDIDLLKEKCFLDKGYFTDLYCMKYQIDKDCLYKWLVNFNKWLMFQGIAVKTEKDYRGHFGNWLYKQESKSEPEKWLLEKSQSRTSSASKTDYQKERDRIKEREKKLLDNGN